MSLTRALVIFFGLLTIDAAVAFVLLAIAGIVAPRGLGATLSVILGGLLLSIFAAYAASAWIYFRLLAAAPSAPPGRYLLVGLFVVAAALLYLISVLITLVVFNR